MIQKRKLAILLFTLIGTMQLYAQKDWSLNECINFAIENNLNHQLYELDEQTALINARQSKLNLLPSVSAYSSAGINFGRSVDQFTYDIVNTQFFNNSSNLNSNVSLFHGFTQLNQIAYSKFRKQAAHWQKINNQDDLAFTILMAYYDVIYYQGLVEIAKEQLKLSSFNLKKTETQIETGLKAKMDLAEMQSTYEMEKLNLLQSENKLAEVKLVLGQQMNLPAGRLVSINIEEAEPVVSSNLSLASDSLFDAFAQQSPYVKIAENDFEAARKNVSIARGNYFPSINLNASVNTGYYETNRDQSGNTISFSDQFENNMSQYVGASISIPIFSRNQIRNNVHRAKIAEQQAQTRLENYRQMAYYELVNNNRELKALFTEYYQTQKQLEADELSYKVAERKYDEGLIDVIQLLTVKQRLAETKSQLLLSRLQWKIKERVIDFYKGIRFWNELEKN
ncbi:TolC family protein [Sunxiuqinia sp. A32]|uniref:TolC family protein n=1 Tax=Sunxiuqinia sp. A32 TaxID=3461496 RepID=UPI004046604E